MTVDQYGICPCGNGKKIKFCKCKESLPELDRVMTMIEGGQVVPAIDRLNQVLSEHPDAAWALAIKGRLMLDLREYDSLAENSERFVRLQPSNPLALAQRAAAELFHDNPEKETLSLLEALTESGRSVDSFVLDISSILAYSLAGSGMYLTARAYVQLPLTAQGYESNQTAAMVYQKLNAGDEINHLVKSVPPPLPRDEGASWGERFDEAIGLLRSNQILLAESKLQSLARMAPREPCVLSGLLTCAIWRGDSATQADCLRKLSECETLDFHSRSKYLALSWLVEPQSPMTTIDSSILEAEISSVDETVMAMSANSRLLSLDSEVLTQFRDVSDGVPPRGGFQIVDRDPPESLETLTAENFPLALGVVLIHGKQTDRAARVEVLELRPSSKDTVTKLLREVLGELNWQESTDRPMSIIESLQVPLAFLGPELDRKKITAFQREIVEKTFAESLAAASLRCLGGHSMNEMKADDSTLLARTALIRLLENYELLEDNDDQIMDAVRERAGVDRLPPLQIDSQKDAEETEAADLAQVEVESLPINTLLFLFQRARLLNVTKLVRSTAKRIIEVELPENVKAAKLTAYTALIEFSASLEESNALIEKAKAYATASNIDQANLRILELTHRLMNGDQVGFNATLRQIADQYGNRPEVMARVQQLLMSLGLLRPDGSFRDRPAAGPGASPAINAPASSPSSGIWTPGSGSPAATTTAAGASKLWIPGMD